MATSERKELLYHWVGETIEERLETEIELYKELKEDQTGRLHDKFGRFASDKPSQSEEIPTLQLILEMSREWGELLKFYSIKWEPSKQDAWGEHRRRIRPGVSAWGLLGFTIFEFIRHMI